MIGADLSPAVVAAARSRRRGLVGVATDVRRLSFRDSSFDVIVSTSTLDHFPDRAFIRESLEEIHRILVPAGRLILTLDNPVHPLIAVRNRSASFWRRIGVVPYRVGETLGPRALRAELTALGFEVVALGAVQHFPRILLVALERFLPKGTRRSRSKLLRAALAWERLRDLPTRYLTGQFVAALARRPPGGSAPSRTRQKS